MAAQPAAGMLAQLAAQMLHLLQDEAGMVGERPAGGRRLHAAPAPLQQAGAECRLHSPDPGAGRGEGQPGTRRTGGDAALVHDGGEQAQVGEVEMHAAKLAQDGSPAYGQDEGRLGQCRIVRMSGGSPCSGP